MAADTVMAPVHPGEILLDEFLKPLGVSQYKLAKELGGPGPADQRDRARPAPHQRWHALRLARFLGTSERFWINLQARYDLEAEKDRLGDALDGIRPLSAAS
jgi:antitoxin HigA-1